VTGILFFEGDSTIWGRKRPRATAAASKLNLMVYTSSTDQWTDDQTQRFAKDQLTIKKAGEPPIKNDDGKEK